MMPTVYSLFETSLGWCGIAWTEPGGDSASSAVARFQLPEATAALTESRIARNAGAGRSSAPPPQIAEVVARVCRHFEGEVQDFRDVAVDFGGVGSFARQVYEAARAIPVGQTRTYGELAQTVGQPRAARAVGQALGRNPVALIIPCHRILAAGGRPGGFSAHGGRTTKAALLAIEGVEFGTTPGAFPDQRTFAFSSDRPAPRSARPRSKTKASRGRG